MLSKRPCYGRLSAEILAAAEVSIILRSHPGSLNAWMLSLRKLSVLLNSGYWFCNAVGSICWLDSTLNS